MTRMPLLQDLFLPRECRSMKISIAQAAAYPMAKRIAFMRRITLAVLTVAASTSLVVCAAGNPISSQWQKHEYEFHYVGFDSAYSCDWLQEKVRLLLKASGARPDMKITGSCLVLNGPSPDATAKMVFYALAPASSDSGQASGSSTIVPAVWRSVSLRDHSPITLESLDCELVAQFRDQILPMFTTRQIIDRTRCRPGEDAPYQLNLQFDALFALPTSQR